MTIKFDHYTFSPEEAARVLAAIGNPSRLLIVTLISHKEWDVGGLARAVGLSQSALPQHLKKLRDLSIVKTRRHDPTVYYRCDASRVLKIRDVLGLWNQRTYSLPGEADSH